MHFNSFNEAADAVKRFIHEGEGDFNEHACALFHLLSKRVLPLRKLCEAKETISNEITNWQDIPALTANSYGEFDITSLCPNDRIVVFHSSGTTSANTSKHWHNSESLSVYEASLQSNFQKKNDSYIRILADRCLNILIRILFNIKLKDTNCALKLIKKESFESFELESLGYSTPTEIILKSNQAGFKIGETGIVHLERQGGVSKLKLFNTAFGFFKVLIYLRLKFHLKRKGLIN